MSKMGYQMTEADRNMIHELYPSLFLKYAPPLSVGEIESCIFNCKYVLGAIVPSLEQQKALKEKKKGNILQKDNNLFPSVTSSGKYDLIEETSEEDVSKDKQSIMDVKDSSDLIILSDSSDNEDTCRAIRSNPVSLYQQRVYAHGHSIVTIDSSSDESLVVSGRHYNVINSDDSDCSKEGTSVVCSLSESISSDDSLEEKGDLVHSILEETFHLNEHLDVENVDNSTDSTASIVISDEYSSHPASVPDVSNVIDIVDDIEESPDPPLPVINSTELQNLALLKLPYFRTVKQLQKEGCSIKYQNLFKSRNGKMVQNGKGRTAKQSSSRNKRS